MALTDDLGNIGNILSNFITTNIAIILMCGLFLYGIAFIIINYSELRQRFGN